MTLKGFKRLCRRDPVLVLLFAALAAVFVGMTWATIALWSI